LNGIEVNGMGRDEFLRVMTERPLSVRVAKPSQKEKGSSEVKQARSFITLFDRDAAVLVLDSRMELRPLQWTSEDQEASIVSIQEEEAITPNNASDFCFCDDAISYISPDRDTCTSLADNSNRSFTSDESEETDVTSFGFHDLVINSFPNGYIGVRLHKESLRVVCITEPGAGNIWCVNDQITAVQHQKVANYDEWLSIVGEPGERCLDSPITVTVIRSEAAESTTAEKARLGMVGGIVGGGAFALTCGALVGGGWVLAAASIVPLSLGSLSGTAVGARRNSNRAAFFSGALAGFAGPTATTAFLGGELVVEACADASEVDC
jgi:hypothetical protein